MANVRFVVEAAFGSYPSSASYTWTKIHDTNGPVGYVRGLQWQRGLDDLIGRTQTGTGQVLLVAGVGLEIAGVAWSNRLVARVIR